MCMCKYDVVVLITVSNVILAFALKAPADASCVSVSLVGFLLSHLIVLTQGVLHRCKTLLFKLSCCSVCQECFH